MKPKHPAPKLSAPAAVTFINGKKHITMKIANTRLEDWVDKSVILKHLGICDKTLRTLREAKKIPCSKLGGIYYYYLPGILFILEQGITS
jgi:hypothetical protein